MAPLHPQNNLLIQFLLAGSPPVEVPYSSSCISARAACERHSGSVMVAVGHAKDPFTFTYVNFLYSFSPSPPYALLGWVPLNLDARVTMGMCVGCCSP